MDAPEELGGQEHFIGSLVTTSETIKSLYSDTRLMFRHQRAEDDIALKPEWADFYATPRGDELDCVSEPIETRSACPLAFLFEGLTSPPFIIS